MRIVITSLLWTVTVIAVVVLVCTTMNQVSAGNPQTKKHVVEIRNLEFTPKKLVVAPGDTILWKNFDLFPHTVTADDKSWDSGTIESNGQWQTVVKKDMLTTYFCQFHPNMKAQISIVQQ